MVLMTTMAECERGEHDKCPKQEAVSQDDFGGVICDCPCHYRAGWSGSEDVEVEFWHANKDGRDPDDFELYLEQFPDGKFAEQARSWLAKRK
jgi:hypothetical protein